MTRLAEKPKSAEGRPREFPHNTAGTVCWNPDCREANLLTIRQSPDKFHCPRCKDIYLWQRISATEVSRLVEQNKEANKPSHLKMERQVQKIKKTDVSPERRTELPTIILEPADNARLYRWVKTGKKYIGRNPARSPEIRPLWGHFVP